LIAKGGASSTYLPAKAHIMRVREGKTNLPVYNPSKIQNKLVKVNK